MAEPFADLVADVMTDCVRVPAGAVEQMLQTRRVTMTRPLGQLPAVLPPDRCPILRRLAPPFGISKSAADHTVALLVDQASRPDPLHESEDDG